MMRFGSILNQILRNLMDKRLPHIVWFTGLPCSGKTTLARLLSDVYKERGLRHILLDGDIVRQGINSDLGFSIEDRAENIRRVAEVNKLLLQSGVHVINCFITPTEAIRRRLKAVLQGYLFHEIYLDTPLHICEQRDVKGMYAKARKGIIRDFTGVDSPFEAPKDAFLRLNTDQITENESLKLIVEALGI